ncbi:hypothetical protein [Celerinatantimonas sp. MCCC 1A17872]|uniref:hypothetical protein n=1 Tax=Celerinatantimonas sp. MCCC 1A17872 TaxID=3177514 RepID=UPI0038C8FB77
MTTKNSQTTGFLFGIYGYRCTYPITNEMFCITPKFWDYKSVNEQFKNKEYLVLMATVELFCDRAEIEQQLFDLEGVLSFIEQSDVVILPKMNNFPEKIDRIWPRRSSGEIIIEDSFFQESRSNFIKLALNALKNEAFRVSFFMVVEVLKQRKNYINISYYLYFTSLESLCRHIEDDEKSSAEEVIYRVLNKKYGFDIKQANPVHLNKGVSTYCAIRNALIHNQKFQTKLYMGNGIIKNIKASDYVNYFYLLVPLVLLKFIGFDDTHINWEQWLNRRAFK